MAQMKIIKGDNPEIHLSADGVTWWRLSVDADGVLITEEVV